MSDHQREIYNSENGDKWFLCRDDNDGAPDRTPASAPDLSIKRDVVDGVRSRRADFAATLIRSHCQREAGTLRKW